MNTPLFKKDVRKSYLSISEDFGGKKPSLFQHKDVKINESTTVTLNLSGDPLMLNRNVSDTISSGVTVIHILKGNIGTGVLALPLAFTYSGLTFGVIGLLVVTIICVHCMHMLINCSQELCCRTYSPPLDYASTAEKAFETGPKSCRQFSKLARTLTHLFVFIAQTGLCVVYWVFVATNLQTAINYANHVEWDYRIYMVILLLPLLAMVLLPNIKYFAPFSMIANVCEVVALGLLFYYLVQDLPPFESRRQLPTVQALPLWFGTVIYSVEIIALVLPLENVMSTPRDMTRWNGVLNTAMALVFLLYIAISFFGYLRFGDHLKGSITLNLPTELLSVLVQVLYATGIYFSFPLQYYVPIEMSKPKISKMFENNPGVALAIFKVGLLAFIFTLGALIPQFELFISLVGAFGGAYMCMIFPPILHMVTYWDRGLSWTSTVKDICILIFGFIGSIMGTYASVLAIVAAFNQ